MKTQAPKHASDEWVGGSFTVPAQGRGSLHCPTPSSLWQGMVNVSYKGHIINALGFTHCLFYQQYENSHRSYIMERMCTCFS